VVLDQPLGRGIRVSTICKSEIEWRDDIDAAPKNQRILMIVVPDVPGHADIEPEIVVAHAYEGKQQWVIANTFGEPRQDARQTLRPLYWAYFGELPPGVTLRRLDIRDFNG
jgi:hypothetical protein